MTWYYKTTGGGGAAATLFIDELLDVNTVSPAPIAGQALVWNGTEWAPGTSVGAPTVFTPTVAANQTVFTLPSLPTIPTSLRLLINGVEYYNGDSYTLVGSTVTWMNEFVIASTDEVRLSYT